MDHVIRPKRGLGALLAATTQTVDESSPELNSSKLLEVTTSEVPIHTIRPNSAQPRTHFDADALNELADSIRAQGLIQPVVVRPLRIDEATGDVKYELIAGERRWRASQLAGLTLIPIVVKSVYDERDILLLSLVENLQRDDLNPIEESIAYEKMSNKFNLTHEQIANGIGKSRVYITNAIRLLDLPSAVIEALKGRKITPGHAKVLLSLPDAALQSHFAAKAQAENLTVRDLERLTVDTLRPEGSSGPISSGDGLALKKHPPRAKGSRGTRLPSAEVQELERRLREHFGTGVVIEEALRKGRIVIDFYSVDDLQRIVNLLHLDN